MKSLPLLGLSAVLLGTLGLTACSSPISKPTAASSSPTVSQFSSSTFTHPFTIALPTWAPKKPSSESATFVTWEASDGNLKLRVMAPVAVFVPNSSVAVPVPTDYSTYLLGLAADGVKFSDVVHLVISGHPAVVVTGTTDDPKDGSLGCPTVGMTPEECFAFQQGLVLRLADIDDNGKPVLVWLRDNAGTKSLDADVAAFDKTLTTLSFTD